MDWLYRIFGKNPAKSFTAWGLVLVGAVRTGEGTGVIPQGTGDAVGDLVQNLAGLVEGLGALAIVVGLRRAAIAPNLAAPKK